MVLNGWTEQPLSKITDKIGDGIHATPNYVEDSEYYFINGNNIKNSRVVITDNTKCISRDEYLKHKVDIGPRTLLLSINGTIGNVGYYNGENIVLGKSAAYINVNSNNSLGYIYYLLSSAPIQNYFISELSGTTIRNLSLKSIRHTKTLLPPLPEQKKIARILSTWDKAIETVDKLIENSQQQKRALMQQLLTHKKRERVRLGKFCEKVGSGVTPRGGSETYKTSGIPLIRSQNVLWGTLNLEDVVFIDEPTHHKMSNSNVEKGDVLLNITGASIGRSCVVPDIQSEANVNQHVCIIRTKNSINPAFLCEFLLSFEGQRQIERFQAGGNRQGLNFQQIKSFKIPRVPADEQEEIAKIVSASNATIEHHKRLLVNIQQQKQALMQQLLNGKRRVQVPE